MPYTLRLALLGGWRLQSPYGAVVVPGAMQRLVAFAALNRAAPSRGYVAGTLWPDGSDTLAQSSLRALLCRIRRRPDLEGLLSISETTVALGPDVRVDVHDLHQALHSTDPPSPEVLDVLTSGELLPGWYDDWLAPERERLHQLRLHALERMAEQHCGQGRHGEALDAALAAVRIEPLRESSHRLVIRVHLQEGNVAEALTHYRDYDALLARELRISPTDRLTDLIRPFIPQPR